ncbi:MAG: polymorphic toxin type 23 domain-containing protein [Ginsengibacter sp.]
MLAPTVGIGGTLGNDGDSYRTAALHVSVGDLNAGFNLFTGYRDYKNEHGSISQHRNPSDIDGFGRSMPNGFATEVGTKYRLGILSVGYKGYNAGVNSEHIRHAIQDQAIHSGLLHQMGFENQSWNWGLYFQYKTPNRFTSW